MSLRLLFIGVLCCCLISCTNSRWVLSALYNRADEMMISDISDHSDFNDQQMVEIRALVRSFHHWHRTTQLPLYAELLDEVAEHSQSGGAVELEQIVIWSERIEGLANNMGFCQPYLFATPLFSSLSDQQVADVIEHRREDYAESLEKFLDRDEAKRFKRRYRESSKWMRRLGLKLNSEQKELLRETMEQEPRLDQVYFDIWKDFIDRLEHVLENRAEPEFAEQLQTLILDDVNSVEQSFPDEVARSRQLWRSFFQQLTAMQSTQQRENFVDWAQTMAANLRAISQQESGADVSSNYCQEYSQRLLQSMLTRDSAQVALIGNLSS